MKRMSALILSGVFLIALSSCNSEKTDVTNVPQTEIQSQAVSEYVIGSTDNRISDTAAATTPESTSGAERTTDGTTEERIVTAAPVDTAQNTDRTRTGVMAFSDSADNKYIKLVSEKYGVPSNVLAAIYTLPYEGMEQEADGNIVLQFDGSVDSEGKLIRTEDTLEMIYMIDADEVCTKASVDGSVPDDYSAAKRTVIVLLTTKYIMPKFQSELY